jgi:hypothetical protein
MDLVIKPGPVACRLPRQAKIFSGHPKLLDIRKTVSEMDCLGSPGADFGRAWRPFLVPTQDI